MSKPLIPNLSDLEELKDFKKILLSNEGISSLLLEDETEKLIIEETVLKEINKEKKVFSFDESLERLRKYGYERHLRPNEAFKMIIDAIEYPESKYKEIYKDMISSYGEWLSLAVERKDQFLICYLDPEGITQDQYFYTKRKMRHIQKYTFEIRNLLSLTRIPLEKIPNDLIEFLYTRRLDDLPDLIKQKSCVLFPESTIAPVSRRGMSIYCSREIDVKNASRGVKVHKKIEEFSNFNF